MKKIYLLASFLGAATFGFSQAAQTTIQRLPQQAFKINAKQDFSNFKSFIAPSTQTKAGGDSIWGSDFHDPTQWTIDKGANMQGDWVVNGTFTDLPMLVQNGYFYYPLHDDTNHFAFFDAVQFRAGAGGPGSADQNAWMTTETIDMTGVDTVTFQFNQVYRAWNWDSTLVEVSLDDGATWGQAQDPNWLVSASDYSPKSLVQLNYEVSGSPTVKFRFHWYCVTAPQDMGSPEGAKGGIAWQVDNVKVFETYKNDIKVTRYYPADIAHLQYSKIPLEQVGSFGVISIVENKGTAEQTNVHMQMTEASTSFSVDGNGRAIQPSVTDSAYIAPNSANAFIPTAIGDYEVNFSILADAIDDVPGNNEMAPYNFHVGGFLYAVDTSSTAKLSQQGGSSFFSPAEYVGTPTIYQGNMFMINHTQELQAIDFQIGSGDSSYWNPEGTLAQGELWVNQGAGNWAVVATTETMLVDSTMGWQYKTLKFDQGSLPVLDSGKLYIAGMKFYDPNYTIAMNGWVDQSQAVRYLQAPSSGTPGWYGYIRGRKQVAVIRMNFDPILATQNNEMVNLHVAQFPNPFANQTTIQYNLEEANEVSYKVVDMAGNVITEGVEGNKLPGAHSFIINGSSFANGIYFLKLKAGTTVVTKKMVVNK